MGLAHLCLGHDWGGDPSFGAVGSRGSVTLLSYWAAAEAVWRLGHQNPSQWSLAHSGHPHCQVCERDCSRNVAIRNRSKWKSWPKTNLLIAYSSVDLKGSPRNEHSDIIYSPSCRSQPAGLSFFFGTQNTIFWEVSVFLFTKKKKEGKLHKWKSVIKGYGLSKWWHSFHFWVNFKQVYCAVAFICFI